MAKRQNNNRRRTKTKYNEEIKYKEGVNAKLSIPHNDPEWYIYDQEMFKGVIQMPTLEFKGSPITWKNNDTSQFTLTNAPDSIKNLVYAEKLAKIRSTNVVAYWMHPGLPKQITMSAYQAGRAPLNLSAINVAARKMYAELSASNAKTSGYAPQDISTLILSLGQVIAMIEHLRRLYGIFMYYDFYNRSIPQDILKAMGITNPDPTRKDLANLRSRINKVISQFDTIQFPAGLNYFKKCKYIYQNIFVDRDEKMTTYQFMTPGSTWILDEVSYNEGSILKTTSTVDTDIDHLVQTVEDMVNNILTSSTFNFIFADIINLSNRNVLNTETFNMEIIPIDYVVSPLYSEQFNWQVMNMTILPQPNGTFVDEQNTNYGTPNNDVYPDADNNLITYAPYRTATYDETFLLNQHIKTHPIRLPDTNISHEQFVELLAYTSRVSIYNLDRSSTGYRINFDNVSDFYCTSANVVARRRRPDEVEVSETTSYGSNVIYSGFYDSLVGLQEIVHFPFMSITNNGFDTPTSLAYDAFSRLSAFTQVDTQALQNLRYQTYLGLFSFKR